MAIRFFSFPKKWILGICFIYGIFIFIHSEIGFKHYIKFRIDKPTTTLADINNKVQVILKETRSMIRSKIGKATTRKKSECPHLSIGRKYIYQEDKIHCKEHVPSESGCIYAKTAYEYDSEKRTCSKEPSITICKIENRQFDCSYNQCETKEVGILTFNKETGSVEEVASLKESEGDLAKLALKHATRSLKEGYKFIFLSCGKALQILHLINLFSKEKPQTKIEHLNINIVLIDSIARAHFYRSLPKTINAFKRLNSDQNPDSAEVLDFKLFQALHGHSAQNDLALFNGTVFPTSYTDDEIESGAKGLQEFYSFFRSKGYHTMYQDDLCYEAIWGLRQDIGGASSWQDLLQKINEASIDETGLTFSNCKVFEKFGDTHVLNLEPENYVCFNGRQHDSYYLDYLTNHYKMLDRVAGKKAISYTILCAAHDYGGVRIQAFDNDLSSFVESMAQLDNTLTVILADHGNTYTNFVYIDLEGKYEQFHPSLFMIIPKGVRDYLGVDKMNSIRSNQDKLVTMLELHHSLKSIADSSHPKKGLFTDISNLRNCSHLPLRFPNLCVCDGWLTPVNNDTEMIGQLEYSIGNLNNIISQSPLNRSCKRLVPTQFKNVFQRKDGDYQITNFEIETEPGKGIANKSEKVSVEVKAKVSGSLTDYDMKLTSWERVSRYGKYFDCSGAADITSQVPLCICDKKPRNKILDFSNIFNHRTSPKYDIFSGIVNETFDIIIKDKLTLVVRKYLEKQYDDDGKETTPKLITITFEVINFSSSNDTYSVLVKPSYVNNIQPLTSGACSVIVPPRTVYYMCTYKRKWNIWQAEILYDTTYKII